MPVFPLLCPAHITSVGRAAMRRCQTRGHKQQKFAFSRCWRLEGCEQVSAGLVSGEDSGLQTLPSPWVFPWPSLRVGTSLASLPLSIRTPVLWDEGPTLVTSRSLISSLKALLPSAVMLRVSAATGGSGRTHWGP